MTTAAKLTGRITIDPPLNANELDLAPATGYLRVAITAGPCDDLGYFEDQGGTIIPNGMAPLSTAGVARDLRDLVALFPGHRFAGALVREAAGRFGGTKSRIAVLDDGRTVQY